MRHGLPPVSRGMQVGSALYVDARVLMLGLSHPCQNQQANRLLFLQTRAWCHAALETPKDSIFTATWCLRSSLRVWVKVRVLG